MTTSVRARLEDAVIERLQALREPAGVKTIRPYAGEMGIGKPEDITRALNGVRPGILVSTERGSFKGMATSRDRYHRDIEIALYLVTGGGTTREDRQRGDNQIYEIADSVLHRLIGIRPLLGDDVAFGAFEPVGEEVLLHTPELLVWVQTWNISVTCDLEEEPAPDITEVRGRITVEDDTADEPLLVGVNHLITPT
jgi:hypothetical protein